MSESFYTFLPWLRTGVGARLTQSATGPKRASVNLKLHIEADDVIQDDPINRSVELYGPGDILGVNTNNIVRTVPRAGANNFESNFLAAIDFYDEDFPWRYSPVAPDADQVAPWLWLLVLKEGEFDLLRPFAAGLPVVQLHAGVSEVAFPKEGQTWAWAHVHLNFKAAQDDNGDPQAAIQYVQTELARNPNLGCSRLMCPRRLEPETEYTAFLIPAFEKGRLAGLGAEPATIDLTHSNQSSFHSSQNSLSNQFPVYYQWSFSTMAGLGFEELASKIKPVTGSDLSELGVGKALTMDIRSPGWGISHADPQPSVTLPSVFCLPGSPAEPEFPAPAPAHDAEWTDSLAQLVNLSVLMQDADANTLLAQPNPVYADGETMENDPVITPPLYGSWYVPEAPPAKVDRAQMKTNWFHQMNLHPALRVVGGVGAEVIRDNQEEYMERAWEQYDEIRETNRFISMAQLASSVSVAVFSKHLSASLQSLSSQEANNKQVRGLRLASMSLSAKVVESGNAQAQARTLVSADAMKMFRPNGPLVSRLAEPTHAAPETFWLKDLKFQIFFPGSSGSTVFNVAKMTKEARIEVDGTTFRSLIGIQEKLEGGALETHKNYFDLFLPGAGPLTRVGSSIYERLLPDFAILRKVKARLSEEAQTATTTGGLGLLRIAPDFAEPMFDALAQQSLDFLMPGLDKFPVDRCGILKSNRTFVEAFMVGLNHEMAREMLWREFPADLRATYFRQFWDKGDTPTNVPPPPKDISPISDWAKPSMFSDASHRVGPVEEPLFFVLRGDLLRKYPNTVVFMQPAWSNEDGTRVPDDSNLKMPIAAARIDQDIFFLGFDITEPQATGDAGWYIGLQERPGDIHFGLDEKDFVSSTSDEDWKNAGTLPGECVDLKNEASLFANLPNAAAVAKLFYQHPYMVLIHATKMLA